MEEQNRKHISEADENGIRYFDMGKGASPQTDANPYRTGAWENGRSKRFWRNFAIVLLIILGVLAFTGATKMAVRAFLGLNDRADGGATGALLPDDAYIATMYVEGTIQTDNTDYLGRAVGYQHQWTLDVLDKLMDDQDNRGLILFVDSPGGTIYESDELYLKIREYQETTGNPVYAVMGSRAASGGYYISAPAERIYANRNTWTGSIGVTIGTIVDFSEFLERYGIKTKTITSGAHKAMGSNYQEMTAEEEAIWQALVDEAYEQFVEIVAEGRGMSKEAVYAIADGRILSAQQAIYAGLVDELGGIDEAYAAMCEELGFYPERSEVRYRENSGGLSRLLGMLGAATGAADGAGEADSLIALAERIESHPASYYCEMLADN